MAIMVPEMPAAATRPRKNAWSPIQERSREPPGKSESSMWSGVVSITSSSQSVSGSSSLGGRDCERVVASTSGRGGTDEVDVGMLLALVLALVLAVPLPLLCPALLDAETRAID